ncbi:hypothetical protein HDU97_007974 [Phlyctochytrium planicorne]|nr:hypothetical protein HDU97_007974 [Phlyctochytrium planicorne]
MKFSIVTFAMAALVAISAHASPTGITADKTIDVSKVGPIADATSFCKICWEAGCTCLRNGCGC